MANKVYYLKSAYGYLRYNDMGWLTTTKSEQAATQFRDGWNAGSMFVQIMSGKWERYYMGGNWDQGIGAYLWNECGYMKWDGDRLVSQSGKTAGHSMVYRNTGFFYFYNISDSGYSAPVALTKVQV